jgi:hypothetical protein
MLLSIRVMDLVPGTVVVGHFGLTYNKSKDLLTANSIAVVGTTDAKNALEPGCIRSRTSRRSLGSGNVGSGLGREPIVDLAFSVSVVDTGGCGIGDGVAIDTLENCGMKIGGVAGVRGVVGIDEGGDTVR